MSADAESRYQAFLEGARAYNAGQAANAQPHTDSDLARNWLKGHRARRIDVENPGDSSVRD